MKERLQQPPGVGNQTITPLSAHGGRFGVFLWAVFAGILGFAEVIRCGTWLPAAPTCAFWNMQE
jgi:hypothetical protein